MALLDNVFQFVQQRARFRKAGMSSKKGLLFYGPRARVAFERTATGKQLATEDVENAPRELLFMGALEW